MRRNSKFYTLAVGTLMLCAFAACSNELNEPTYGTPGQTVGVSMAKTPDIMAWSGNQVLGISYNGSFPTTRSANVNGNEWAAKWNVPGEITKEELNDVLTAFSQPINYENSIHIDFENYWVQQVYTGTSIYQANNGGYVTGSQQMNRLLAYNENFSEIIYGGYWDADKNQYVQTQEVSHYEHVNNFNSGSNNTYGGLMLMENMVCPSGIEKQFGYHNSTDSQNHFEYIILEINGDYYVGFDFYANGQNSNQQVERDHIYNDWIVKITPATLKNSTETPDNGGNTQPETPEKPGDDGDDNNGDDDDDVVVTPGKPYLHNDEVEVNLSINDIHTNYDIADLVSKLSIHVRKGTDVRIFIPVPAEYVIAADDMAILQMHKDDLSIYGGPQTLSYVIDGNTVTLNCQFDANGITVWTDGINQDVIDYLMERNGDGINFEIYNYFNKGNSQLEWGEDPADYPALTESQLKEFLDKSTIDFLDEYPTYYINAFGWKYVDGQPTSDMSERDCIVRPLYGPVHSQGYHTHLNGTPYNMIYTDGTAPDHSHGAE